MAISNKKKKELAERMFIDEGMTGIAIANDLEVSAVTISKWRKDGKWDERKTQLLAAPHKIKELLLKELGKVSGGEISTIDADKLAKISKVIDTLNDKVSVQVVVTVLKEFDNWMADQEPEIAVKFLEFHKSFILYKAGQESICQ